MRYVPGVCAAIITLSLLLRSGDPAGALPIGPPGGGTGPVCNNNADCDDGDPCTIGERCVSPGSDDAQCLAPTDTICEPTTTSSTTSTSSSSSSTSSSTSTTPAPTIPPTTSSTSVTGATTSTTLTSGTCAPDAACDDGDPCTLDACVEAACAHTPATGIAAAICVCDRATPETCPASLPRAGVKPFVRACALARVVNADGAAAKKKLFSRATRKFKAMGARASKLGAKGTLPSACADPLAGAAQQAQQGLTTALQAR